MLCALSRAVVPARSFSTSAFACGSKKEVSNGRTGGLRDVVLIEGVRTPFLISGTGYNDLMAYDLARIATEGLFVRTAAPKDLVDAVVFGTVIQEAKTSNIAREAMLGAGLPNSIPAYTETMACISSNRSACTGIELIRGGQAEIVVAGGVETMSDVPIRFSKKMRQKLLNAKAAQRKGPLALVQHFLKGMSFKDFITPDLPAIAEFSTGEVMGSSADRLAARFGITRDAQEDYAIRSHHAAAKASQAGLLADVLSVSVPPKFVLIDKDNVFNANLTKEECKKKEPAFIKPHGTITAPTSSRQTDGASAALISSVEGAKKLGLKPKAYLRDYIWSAQDPKEELLLGPAYSVARLLHRNNLTLADIDVFEIHEAFAAQVLANIAALDDEAFCRNAGVPGKVGVIPVDKLNNLGGSLSLGHPFGATGVRLISTAANRLIQEDGRLALLASCAAGGLGHAMLIERF